jgi:hypothetical protein
VATNLSQLRTIVARSLKWDTNDSEAMAIVDQALNDAYDMVNGHRHWKRLRESATSTVTGTSTTVDVTSTWRTLTGVFIINAAGNARELPYISWNEELARYGDPAELTRDTPARYILDTDTDGSLGARKFVIRLVPYPNATFTVRQAGIVQVAHLSGNTDVPWFDDAFHGLLADFARADLIATQSGFEPELAGYFQQRGERRLVDMIMSEPVAATPTYSIPLIAGT